MIQVPHLWDGIFGNRALKELLLSDIYRGKLAHAYILEGPESSGKRMLARTIASSMANTMEDVKKIATGVCPDVIEVTLPDNKKSIGVDNIRPLKLAAYYKPNDLDVKFFILHHGETLTTAAQNALLKLIEEPPENVFILLLCENAATLLPTIRSRAPILRLQVFSPEELAEILLEHSVDARILASKNREAFDAILRSCHGAYGAALARIVNIQAKVGDSVALVADIMEALVARDTMALFRKIQSLPPDRREFSSALMLLRQAVRDVIAYRATRGSCDYLFPKSDRTPFYAGKLSLERLLSISDALSQVYEQMLTNPNLQTVKTILYCELSRL